MKAWFASDSFTRVWRTLVQVFGGVVIAFVLAVLNDYGADGVVVLRDHIFGQSGLIIAATVALALAMNGKTPPPTE